MRHYYALVGAIAAVVAVGGVVGYELWPGNGPEQLRVATAPILLMQGNAAVWDKQTEDSACRLLLRQSENEAVEGLKLLKYVGLGRIFPAFEERELDKTTADTKVDVRYEDLKTTVDGVREWKYAGAESANLPPPTEPQTYSLIPNMANGAAARHYAFLPLVGPFRALGFWRAGLFVQMLVIAAASSLAAMGTVKAVDACKVKRDRRQEG